MMKKKNNVIYFSLFGGVGNQMFQYAAGQAVAREQSRQVKYLFIPSYRRNSKTSSHHCVYVPYELNPFGIECKNLGISPRFLFGGIRSFLIRMYNFIISKYVKYLRQKVVFEPREFQFMKWSELFLMKPPQLAWGYWQSEEYFQAIAEDIRTIFDLEKVASDEAKNIAHHIHSTKNATSVHLRLNDYVKLGIQLEMTYYTKAKEKIEKSVQPEAYFVFSDDIETAKKMFSAWNNAVFIDCKQSIFDDMYLMHLCQHNITANSTYSWWAAWLNKNSDKIVTLPKPSFHVKKQNAKREDMNLSMKNSIIL